MTRLGKRYQYQDSIETLFPICGEENDLHAMKCILYDIGPLTIARLFGLEFAHLQG